MGLVDAGLAFGKEGIGSGFVFCAGHVAVVGENAHDGQVVALAHFVVVGVMGRGDLHHTGALFHIGMLVADDGDFFIDQGQDHVAAMQMGIAGVIGVDGHGGIAQHGFGTGGGQLQHFAGFLHGIEDVPEIAVLFFVFHFGVGNGGVAAGAPVDQAVALIDETFFIQAHKHFAHGVGAAFVHGEAFTAPVAGGAHAA